MTRPTVTALASIWCSFLQRLGELGLGPVRVRLHELLDELPLCRFDLARLTGRSVRRELVSRNTSGAPARVAAAPLTSHFFEGGLEGVLRRRSLVRST